MPCMEWNPGHCGSKQSAHWANPQPPHKYCQLFSQYQVCIFSPRAFWLYMTEASSPVHAPGIISRRPALNQGPFAQRQHAGRSFLNTLHKFSGWLPSELWDLLTSFLLDLEPWFWTRWKAGVGCSEVTDSPLLFQLKKAILMCFNKLESILNHISLFPLKWRLCCFVLFLLKPLLWLPSMLPGLLDLVCLLQEAEAKAKKIKIG